LIVPGKIVKVRGNKGEVVYTSPDLKAKALEEGEAVILESEKYQREYIVEYARTIKGACVVKFTGINSINEALKLVGYSIYKRNAEAGDIKNENNQWEDFMVIDLNGQLWGKVKNIEADTFNELLEVQGEEKNDLYYVPFTDTIVKEINKEKRIIVIDPPDGLKDLNKK
jgi:16S rRNA processing protein RimM